MPTETQTIKGADLLAGETYNYTGNVLVENGVPPGVVINVHKGTLTVEGDVGFHSVLKSKKILKVEGDVGYQSSLTSTNQDVQIKGNVQGECKLVAARDVIVKGKGPHGHGITLEYGRANQSTIQGKQNSKYGATQKAAEAAEANKQQQKDSVPTLVQAADLSLYTSNDYEEEILVQGDLPAGVTINSTAKVTLTGKMGARCTINTTGDVSVPFISADSEVSGYNVYAGPIDTGAIVTAGRDLEVIGNVGAEAILTTARHLRTTGAVDQSAILSYGGQYRDASGRVRYGTNEPTTQERTEKNLGLGISYFPLKGEFIIPAALLSRITEPGHEGLLKVMERVQILSQTGSTQIQPINPEQNKICDVKILTYKNKVSASQIERDILAYTKQIGTGRSR